MTSPGSEMLNDGIDRVSERFDEKMRGYSIYFVRKAGYLQSSMGISQFIFSSFTIRHNWLETRYFHIESLT